MTTPSDSLRLKVLAAARAHPAPVRGSHLLPSLSLAGLSAAAMWVIFQLVGGASRTAGRPFLTGLWLMAGTGVLAALASWLTLPPRRSMLSRPRGFLWAVIVGVPVLVGASLALWHSAYPDPFTRFGFLCFALTVGTAPWPFLALRMVSARVDPRHPRLGGAALGTASGAWAAVLVEGWCPLAAPAHVAFGHVLPLLCLALAGALLGSRLHRVNRVG